jgi:CDP-diacylglycerol--glycerol-3-phosphate 3-phosphatidyltransferase
MLILQASVSGVFTGSSDNKVTKFFRSFGRRGPGFIAEMFCFAGGFCLYIAENSEASQMNVPNKLTISRFVLTFAFLAVIFAKRMFYETVALALFSVAGLTDYFDGKIARRDNLITNFGILMDPLADKIMVCSAFIAFVGCGWVQAWMVVIIVARELAITGLRLLAASKNLVLAAERFGKHKTISQIVAIISLLVVHSYQQWGVVGKLFAVDIIWGPWVTWFAPLSLWVAVILTFISGVIYLWRNRSLYLMDL